MSRQRKIKNTNIRLDLMEPEDRQAWEYLQNMDREEYKSYSRAVVAALNDYFGRRKQLEDDPYLETRSKEDAFLLKVMEAAEKGAREGMLTGWAGNLLQVFQPIMGQQLHPSQPYKMENIAMAQDEEQDCEEMEDAALDFADNF